MPLCNKLDVAKAERFPQRRKIIFVPEIEISAILLVVGFRCRD
jgi:hypothetical protein